MNKDGYMMNVPVDVHLPVVTHHPGYAYWFVNQDVDVRMDLY